MGFFRRADEGATGEDADGRARIEAGGIPLSAEQRLKSLAGERPLFTSGLSVKEFALLGSLGPRPLAQVMGASVIRTGWQYLPALEPGLRSTTTAYSGRSAGLGPTPTGRALQTPYTEPSMAQVRNYQWRTAVICELEVLSDAWYMARRRALDRLAEEALQVGADAVVGVHLRHSDHDLGENTIEYVVSGTAIRHPDSQGAGYPVLTDVSVQDYWRLRQAGHEPAGLLATTSVVFASPARMTRARRARGFRASQELTELSQAFQAARDTARARLLGQVGDAHGTDAVGVEFSHTIRRDKLALASSLTGSMRRGWYRNQLGIPYFVSGHSDTERKGWVITMHAAGTAVRRRRDTAPLPERQTTIRMSSR